MYYIKINLFKIKIFIIMMNYINCLKNLKLQQQSKDQDFCLQSNRSGFNSRLSHIFCLFFINYINIRSKIFYFLLQLVHQNKLQLLHSLPSILTLSSKDSISFKTNFFPSSLKYFLLLRKSHLNLIKASTKLFKQIFPLDFLLIFLK